MFLGFSQAHHCGENMIKIFILAIAHSHARKPIAIREVFQEFTPIYRY